MASEICSAELDSLPAKSAIVLDTFRILSYALADKPLYSIAIFSSLPLSASSSQKRRIINDVICAFE